MPGMRISLMMTFGVCVSSAASKSSAHSKVLLGMSSPDSAFSITQRIELSSSTTQISVELVIKFFHWYEQGEACMPRLTHRLNNTPMSGKC